MKTILRCTAAICTCPVLAKACRHVTSHPARQITQGRDRARIADIGNVLEADLQAAAEHIETLKGGADGVPISGLPLKNGEELPDFAIPLAEKAQAMIAAFDLLSDEAWASLPEPVWTQIQSAADHLQLAIFNYKTKGAQA